MAQVLELNLLKWRWIKTKFFFQKLWKKSGPDLWIFLDFDRRVPVIHLNEVFQYIAFQLGSKFKYSNIDSKSSHLLLKDSLELLVKAGLAYRVYHTSARGLPLGAQVDHKKFKVLLFDLGILQRIYKTDLSQWIVSTDFNHLNKGRIAEAFIGLELIQHASLFSKSELYYWHREAKSSNAEIDYLIQNNQTLLPIEVKSGTKGQMQSMFIFLKEFNLNKGLRISSENFSSCDPIDNLPLYAISSLKY